MKFALVNGGRRSLHQLLRSQVSLQSSVLSGQRRFSAEPAPAESEDSVTVTVNPFKGHRLEPPSRDVQTSKKELLEMFEVTLHLPLHALCSVRCATS